MIHYGQISVSKKFVFVNLAVGGYNSGINHGIAYLVPVVKRHSYEVSCINIMDQMSPEEFYGKVCSLEPSIVGFSSLSHHLKYLRMYSAALRSRPEILQIAGGAGPTLDPESAFTESALRAVCIGEAEKPLDNLLKAIEENADISSVEGFWWSLPEGIRKNPVPQFVSDLSTLDFPDYSVFDRDLAYHNSALLVMLSRGCPNNCSYCCNKALSGVYPSGKGYFRLPSAKYAINLLKRLVAEFPEARFIDFEDDLLIADKRWFEDFARRYKESIGLAYRVCGRSEFIDKDIVAFLKSSGCKAVYVGLESGNEHFRKTVLNRQYSNELLLDRCKMIKAAGIGLFTFNMIGFPSETKSHMRDTFMLNRRIKPDMGVCAFFYPYKGTRLYEICKQQNMLKDESEMLDIANCRTCPSIKMPARHEADCLKYYKRISNYLQPPRFGSFSPAANFIMRRRLLYAAARVAYRISGLRLVFIYFKRYRDRARF